MTRTPGWLESRLPLGRWLRALVDEDVPGGASYWYVFGSAVTLVFVVLVATGIWQLLYYVPSTENAYNSVNFLRFQVPFGWFVHGLHFWAASAMVVLALVHLVQVFVWGAFKKPREFTWVLGGLLLLLSLLGMITGTWLVWDKRGYLGAQVALGIAGSVPVVGDMAKRLLGGSTLGQVSLSHFFTLHLAIVPLALAVALGIHIVAFRIPGAAASFSEKRNLSRTGSFWPQQVLKDFIAFSVVFVALVGLSAFLSTPVTGAADPLDASYVGRPEWPFLFFYQILKSIPGRFEGIAAGGIPLLMLGVLFAVPWLDRSAERSPLRRPIPMGVFGLILVSTLVLSVLGGSGTSEVVSKSSGGAASVESSGSVAPTNGPKPTAPYIVGNAEHGATVFADFCESCHGPGGNGEGAGDVLGPPLAPLDEAFVSRSPQQFALNIDEIMQSGSFSKGKVLMPPFGASSAMTQPQIADAEAYVLRRNGVDRAAIVDPGVDPRIFFYVALGVFAVADIAALIALARARSAPDRVTHA
jgi:ubiquinol-cytochrome c reductase cytochrome b subunit